jgi:hypothetical protein
VAEFRQEGPQPVSCGGCHCQLARKRKPKNNPDLLSAQWKKTEILATNVIALVHAYSVLSSARCKYAVVKEKPGVIESGALVVGVGS